MPNKKPTKSYKLSPEALDAIDALDEKITGKCKSQIVSEAIVQYALDHGVKVKGHKKKDTVDSIAKRTAKLERTLKALCRMTLYYECERDKEYEEAETAILEAIESGTKINTNALWREVKEKLPECMKDEDYFRIYIGGHGFPKAKVTRRKKKT